MPIAPPNSGPRQLPYVRAGREFLALIGYPQTSAGLHMRNCARPGNLINVYMYNLPGNLIPPAGAAVTRTSQPKTTSSLLAKNKKNEVAVTYFFFLNGWSSLVHQKQISIRK